jgi:hypothetical protein
MERRTATGADRLVLTSRLGTSSRATTSRRPPSIPSCNALASPVGICRCGGVLYPIVVAKSLTGLPATFQESLKPCTMIVCAADDFAGTIHGRMPTLLLAKKDFESWLNGRAGVDLSFRRRHLVPWH